ncbi:lysM and putative peptidoglycan-binding domain-containing protein 1-like isoform X2 [Amphibalanus amphitrite]|uniref:lysM and putative peptidoglycan-binding domain-containing protein 1-like isoform X2 n=1 Tax=Amphibalanus amphitrite TaxID=1232801 RepID=UPI001C9246AD|nr:lysM and putative peptidoglycan-binding domain-containing protein 1-like isoform X2 [Amphibalanus amphitrite]XP_043241245.1 lysM and putative peptidoglycan-binding domain-containing protein 1-like isoform X2 [Amphibalanus amphitrite]
MMTSLEPAGDRDLNLNHVKAADVFASHAVASERRVSEDGPAIMEEINQGQMLVLAALKETKMAYSRDEERSLISSFNKEQRKYGSTSTYVNKPERFISYEIQPGDTLQGISLKHNVTMEQLKRANKLWTNDSLALRRTLLVPIPLEPGGEQQAPPAAGAAAVLSASTSLDSLHSSSSCSTRTNGVPRSGSQTELDRSEQSAADFLSGIDSVIASSRTNVQKLGTNQPWGSEAVAFARTKWNNFNDDFDESAV